MDKPLDLSTPVGATDSGRAPTFERAGGIRPVTLSHDLTDRG